MLWVDPGAVEVSEQLRAAVGGHPLVSEVLARRGILTAEEALAFLDPDCYDPGSPMELPDMAQAVDRLRQAITSGERILVWGDFDVDGLTGTALLVEALRSLGGEVLWYIPDRHRESHGLNWRSLQPFLGRGVRVLLTCDTGVSAHEEIALAANAGLDVLVTDHHNLPVSLPKARAVVNPKRLPVGHTQHHLSGVGVAYKLAEALGMGESGLDLVALGLVADVVPQLGEVRYLVQRGLQALRRGRRVGLQALLEVADLSPATLDEGQIGFALAPRLNALGRLAEASAAVELFLTEDMIRARTIAAEMEALNVRRQFLSRQVTAGAREQAERDPTALAGPVLVLTHPDWPAGVLGIAASRLVEVYDKPVVLIATPLGEMARASARSRPGLDIHAALSAHSALLGGFGGHPMAAGFTIDPARIPELKQALAQTIGAWAHKLPAKREVRIESYFGLPELNLYLLDQLERLTPFGPGNPPVYLATRQLQIARQRTIGRTTEHRHLELRDEQGHTLPAVWWQSADLPVPEGVFDLAYVLRGYDSPSGRALQLEWVDARGVEPRAIELRAALAMPDVADYRTVRHPLPVLQALWDEAALPGRFPLPSGELCWTDAEELQLWSEALAVPGFVACNRRQLRQSLVLIVWTIPPGPRVWEDALLCVQPRQVYLFALDAGMDGPVAFRRRLLGLIKHALDAYGGRLEWKVLAAVMGHRVETVRAGLRWLAAEGLLSLVSEDPGATVVKQGGRQDRQAKGIVGRELDQLLKETAAYRAHFCRADARLLVGGYRAVEASR